MRDNQKFNKSKESLAKVLGGEHYRDQFVKVYGLKGMFSIWNTETNRCIVGIRHSATDTNYQRAYIQHNSWYAPYLSRHFAGKGYQVEKTNSNNTNSVQGARKAYKKIERWTK